MAKQVGFAAIVRKLRQKASKDTPSLSMISKEVEIVRAKRYLSKKGEG